MSQAPTAEHQRLADSAARRVHLGAVADDHSRRLTQIFLRDEARGGRRPVLGGKDLFQTDPHWRDHVPFHEYFHGDNGAGLGASHQTGWTTPVAELLRPCAGRTASSDPELSGQQPTKGPIPDSAAGSAPSKR